MVFWFRLFAVFGHAPRTDHFHVVVHHAPRARRIAHHDERGELLVNF
jgi:hypothetical protein